jgi:biotin carboxyl carrier protein
MISHRAIPTIVLLALVAGGISCRPDDKPKEEEEERLPEADPEDPIVAPSRVAVEGGEARVVLDTAEIRRIGLTTAVLRGAVLESGPRLIGQVVPEPERIATLRAPVSGRLAVPEGGRWPALGDRLDAGATVGAVSDARPLVVPIAGLVRRIGAQPGELVEAGQVLLEVADNSRPVVRITWSDPTRNPGPRLLLVPPGTETRIAADLIGPALEADPLTRSPAYLYRANGRWPGAVPGTPVSAIVPGGGKAEGLLVPDGAVVQWEGFAWVYLQREPGSYARVRVPTDRPAPGGWIAGPPLAVGDTVVLAGVQELLSEEFRARVTVGEESGE